jgi:hypothetical protein
MNSPPAEDTSPYTTDSDVPGDNNAQGGQQQGKGIAGGATEIVNFVSSRLPGGKRRIGGSGGAGSSGAGSGRDLKSRRREDTRKIVAGGASGATREWVEGAIVGSGGPEKGGGPGAGGRGRDYKDELLDGPLIDQLRASQCFILFHLVAFLDVDVRCANRYRGPV